ncbi:MAG: amino acid transporter, partial [Halobacteriales archaeon]
PLSAVSLLIGFLILGVMGLVVAFLGIGAVIDLVRPESNGPPPRQQA